MPIAEDVLPENQTFQSAVSLAHAIKSKTAQAEALLANIRNTVFSEEQRASFREDLDTLLVDIKILQAKLNKAAGLEDRQIREWEDALRRAAGPDRVKVKVGESPANPFYPGSALSPDVRRALAKAEGAYGVGGPIEAPVKNTRGVLELGFMTREQAVAHRDRLRRAGVV